jgi:putative hydrolase of the HAD superfamily
MQSIEAILNNLDVMKPLGTGLKASMRKLDIEAFIFDIYGTLIISATGDIDKMTVSTEHLKIAFDIGKMEITPQNGSSEKELFHSLLVDFRNAIISYHAEKKSGETPFPEVDIEDIWTMVLSRAAREGKVTLKEDADLRALTIAFELMSNKVYPMPGMEELLQSIKNAGKPMGIISNAQFYTPVIMNFFLQKKIIFDRYIPPFNEDLIIYSFEEKRSKPDTYLYHKLAGRLKDNYGVDPRKALFIGNDMLKDIYAAKKAGFKTALFAGDQRSLRLRENKAAVKNVIPDIIITDLNQLKDLLSP